MKELQDSNYKDGVLIVARDSETNELVGTGGCMRILRRLQSVLLPHCVNVLSSIIITTPYSLIRRQDHVFDLGLVVSQSHWGQGVGRAMMERMIEEARSRGGRKISLDFNSDNSKAQRMYERLGFVQEGRMRNQLCVDGQYKDLVMMSLFLKK